AYALRRTREPELAEDAVSETFFTAWRKLDEVPDDALPWLYAVARRALANARRSRRRRQALVSRLTHEMRYALAQHTDPAEALEMSEALERLTDEDREILMLVA